MRSASFHLCRRRRGVSEVLGALLLIIVVIAVVSSLAFFVSEAQKSAEQRQAYLTSVQNEDLQIVGAQFSPSNPNIQWQLDNTTDIAGCTSHCVPEYYVQVLSGSELLLTQLDTHNSLTITTLNVGSGAAPAPASSLFIHKGTTANLFASNSTLKFSETNYVFEPAAWSNVTISVRNLNTEESGLSQIQVNSNWMPAWQEVTQSGGVLSPAVLGAPNNAAIVIPAKATLSFNLSLASAGITLTKNESAKITLLTSVGNYFTTNYSPPSAVVRSSTASENYQVVTRDVVTLDGSQTLTSNSIQSYTWQIVLPTNTAGCTTSSFGNPSDLDVAYATGETIQYLPESLFSTTQLANDCITGPIEATLTVVDNYGLSSTSQPLLIAPDSDIAPISSISVINKGAPVICTPAPCDNTETVTIQVDNIFGNPYGGALVTAIVTSGDVSAPAAGTTNPSGQVAFTVSWPNGGSGGSVEFATGDLPPVQVSIP